MFELTSAIDNIGLYRASVELLGVKGLDVFSRVHSENGQGTSDACVVKSWYSEITPPAAPPACLAHVELASAKNRAEVLGAKTVACIPDSGSVVVQGPVTRGPNWNDPVATALTHLDVWSGGGNIPFGGFGYKLLIRTTHLRAVLAFGRTAHPSRRAIACAMLEVATSLGSSGAPAVGAFLDLWARDIRSLGAK